MQQSETNPISLLVGLRQHHIVNVFNPLSRDFTWTVARSVSEADNQYVDQTIRQLGLRNDMHPTMKHVVQKITLPQGKSMNLPGDVAQVIVKHLVDEIMNLRGHKATIGDAELRRGVEEEVIVNTQDLRSQLSTLNIEDQLNKQIEDLNRQNINDIKEVKHDETEAKEHDGPAVFGGSNRETGDEKAVSGAGVESVTEPDTVAKTESRNSKK